MIPVIKVNYRLWEILEAMFIPAGGHKHLSRLEKVVCRYFGVDGVMFASSGRAALYFVLRALPQRKVVVPAYTCDAVVEAAMLAGKEVVYAHVRGRNLDMDLEGLVDAGTVVVATHQFGMPCDIENICAVCRAKGAVVVEDCAGALGTRMNGRLAGTFGDFAFFSLNASKLVTAPAMGGFAIANRPGGIGRLKQSVHLAPCTAKYKIRSLMKSLALCLYKNAFLHDVLARTRRKAGRKKTHVEAGTYAPKKEWLGGYMNPFCDWQAKTVLRQFQRIDALLAERKRMFDVYMDVFRECRRQTGFDNAPTGNRFPLCVEDRREVVSLFRARGIATASGFDHFVCPGDHVRELELAGRILYLPFGNGFTGKQIGKIASVLRSALSNREPASDRRADQDSTCP